MDSEEKKCLLKKKNLFYGSTQEERKQKTEVRRIENEEADSDWLVVLTSFLSICVVYGMLCSYGVFLEPLMSELSESRDTISLAGTMQVFLAAATAPVASYLVRRTGAASVCQAGAVTAAFGLLLASFSSSIVGILLGLGLLSGMGFCLVFISSVVGVAETFTTRRSFAVGVSLCGGSVGLIGAPSVVGWMIGWCGWRGGLQVMTGVMLGCVGLVWKAWNNKEKITEIQDEEEGTQQKNVCMSRIVGRSISSTIYLPVFLLILLGDTLAVLGFFTTYTTSVAPGLVWLGSVPGCLMAGWLSDQPWCHPLYLTRVLISTSCAIPFLLASVDQAWVITVLTLLFGFLTGSCIAATTPLLVSLLGLNNFSHSFGILTATRGAASLLSIALSSPSQVFYISGILLLLSGCVYSAAIWVLERKRKKSVGIPDI